MIIFMSDILCVTNRLLCKEDFLCRIDKIAKCSPKGIILREKDLNEAEYMALAKKVIEVCEKYHVPCILHSFVDVAITLRMDKIHLPLQLLRGMSEAEKACFTVIGASCHCALEAIEAEQLGCTYIVAGHIFATDCKKGVEPRGIDFLERVCKSVAVPVYAIGGITSSNMKKVLKAGAQGGCMMSGLMCCEKIESYIDEISMRGMSLNEVVRRQTNDDLR